jgi:hypothetical protein
VVFGAIASRFFTVGNTVPGNNITAKARLCSWMMSKALGCQQTITDGGAYDPLKARYFDPTYRKPGLDVLASGWDWHSHNRKRWARPLEGKLNDDSLAPSGHALILTGGATSHKSLRGTKTGVPRLPHSDQKGLPSVRSSEPETDLKKLDRMALDHIKSFWSGYDLDFPFQVEHKTAFVAGAFFGKADYALSPPDEETSYKVRGIRKEDKFHPKRVLLDHLLAGCDDFPQSMAYTKGGLLTVGKYRVIQECSGYEGMKHLRPGDNLPTTHHQQRFNNNWFPMDNESDYLRIKNRKKTDRGKSAQFFEKFGQLGITKVHSRMTKNQLR